ncbi:hypothetical protein [Deinococcus cellulosilyticus]|uniref:Uncharacterized protein n=1 Tax=Deinococcus cellulosilyticus (strain DSM 18568 / NBRC 106333 / KACC 11606 / 5516J-15) TaxID=1223518 RepID=A0A511MV96_DEIC1|nr:hypothetical protein [Deinococcus cellulosilyticus]GEM44503.1 hypothetical protein DC3_01380 [Deinococcus cellulosilyticus NBRC 106333 = KACC 11606]
MLHIHKSLPILMLSSLLGSAAAASVPETLVAEWLAGEPYPAEYFNIATTDFRSASTGAERLVIRKDGTYEFAQLKTGATPGYFGSLLIACETIDLYWEKGTVKVNGSQLVLHPTSSKSRTGATPVRHNNGCTVYKGFENTRTPQDRTLKFSVQGGTLKLTSGQSTSSYNTRAPQASKPSATPSKPTRAQTQTSSGSKLSSNLQGEWYSGTVSPMEYYNVTTGLWTNASGTSTILKLNGDGTYMKTGLLTISTFGCNSKLFVQEQGKVAQSGNQLNFTPTSSLSQGYTCSPDHSYKQENTAKPSSVKYSLEQREYGLTLSLTTADGTTIYRPSEGTGSTPANTSSSNTASNSGYSNSTPVQQQVKPIRTDASGNWNVLLSAGGETLELTISVDEDDRGIMGNVYMQGEYVGYVMGNRNTGVLSLTLNDDDETTFKAQGNFRNNPDNARYPIDYYLGEFEATNVRGESLGNGALELSRPQN